MIADYASAAKTTGTRYLNAAKNTENTRFLRHTQCAAGAEAAYKQSASKQTKMTKIFWKCVENLLIFSFNNAKILRQRISQEGFFYVQSMQYLW